VGPGLDDHYFDAAATWHLPPHDPGAPGPDDETLVGALDAMFDDEALLEADAALAAATAGVAGATGVPLTGAIPPWPPVAVAVDGLGGFGQGAGPATHLSHQWQGHGG
jgi:hypothetical protein